MEEILIKLLEFVDKQTDWKENNDTTNSQVVQEFINKNKSLVKLFAISDVVGQSEQLKDFLQEVADLYKDYSSTLIKLKAKELLKGF